MTKVDMSVFCKMGLVYLEQEHLELFNGYIKC